MVASGGDYVGQAENLVSESHIVEDGTFVWQIVDSFADGGFLDDLFFNVPCHLLIHLFSLFSLQEFAAFREMAVTLLAEMESR